MKNHFIKVIFVFFIFLPSFAYTNSILPIPAKIEYDLEKAKLGKKLFFDTKLSANNTISCASCHNLEIGGDDNLKFSFGIHGQEGFMNAPTVFNAIFNFRQFWNGRARTLQEQAKGSIQNKLEMAHDLEVLSKELQKEGAYKQAFEKIYTNGISAENIVDAIAEFEKTLITPNSRFDQYLNGNKNILTKQESRGYELFVTKGCIGCHHGVNVGGNMYAKIGIVQKQQLSQKGLYDLTKDEDDMYLFKVPSLRNIEHTAPYGFLGQYETLYEVVYDIAYKQLGIRLQDDEVKDIVAFLKTLSGEVSIIDD